MQALNENQWSKLWFEMRIAASPDVVFQAFATDRGLESWFGPVSPYQSPQGRSRTADELVQPGDRFAWKNFGLEGDATGVVIVATAPRNLTFALANERLCVRVKIHAEGAGSRIEVIEESVPASPGMRLAWEKDGRMDWTSRLLRLKDACEAR